MADAPTTPGTEASAQPGTAPANPPTVEHLTRAEAQDLANRAAATTRREYEAKLEALKADYESKLKNAPPKDKAPVDPADLLFRLEFSDAMLDVTSELGPIASGARERLRKLASVDKPSDLTAWLRGEIGALGLAAKKVDPVAAPVEKPAPVLPGNAAAAPAGSPAVDLNGPLSVTQLLDPTVSRTIMAREGASGLLKRYQAAGAGTTTGKAWSWGK